MKKFTSFMLMLLCAVTTWAGVTDLPEMSTDGDIKWYTIKNTRSTQGGYLYYTANGVKDTNTRTAASFFYFTGTPEACKIHNYTTDLLFTGAGAWNADGVACALTVSPLNTGVMIGFDSTFLNEQNWGDGYTTWGDVEDTGSIFVIERVTDFSAIIDITATKAAAIAEIKNLATQSHIYPATTTYEEEINAVQAASNGLADLNAAVEAINGKVLAYKATAYAALAGKYYSIYTPSRNNGRYLKMSSSSVVGTADLNDPANIWQFVANNDKVYIYNPYTGKYLCEPGDNSSLIGVTTDQSAAAGYELTVNNSNPADEAAKLKLTSNGKSVHVDGSNNLVRWDNGGASEYTVTLVEDFTSIIDLYKSATIASMDSWKTLTVVFDEELIEEAETAINAVTTTTYSAFAEIDSKLTAVTDAVAAKMFTFRNADTATAARVDAYLSANEATGKGYGTKTQDYYSIWSLCHATGTAFYLYNELTGKYLGTPGEGNLVDTPSAAYTFEITDAETNQAELHCGTATLHLANSCSLMSYDNNDPASRWYISTINIAADIDAILADLTEADYAEVPELGQYTTAAYLALVEARTTARTVEEVEHAIAAFHAAKNLPVFTIDGVISYAAGKSVYDDQDGAPSFKATNLYDKTMWWAFDQTATTVGVTESVNVVNYSTRKGFWGAKALKITETSDANEEDGIFLFYTVDNGTPLHYQEQDQVITRWGSDASTSGSATKFTYIGNTYDLDNLTDEKIAALGELKAAYNAKKVYENYEVGTAVGQYSGNKEAIIAALEGAEIFLDATLAQQATATVENINAATTALNNAAVLEINLPIGGRYYRIAYNYDGVLKYVQAEASGVQDKENAMLMSKDKGAASIFYFSGSSLLSYTAGKYIKEDGGERGLDGNTMLGGVNAAQVSFEAGSVAGTIAVKAPSYMHANSHDGIDFIDHCGGAGHNAHNFIIEEVESLPVTITAAGYATFYAPVEVSADGVEAYYTTGEKVEGHETYLNMVAFQNNVIPALQGAILKGEQGEYEFAINYNAPLYPNHEGNLLCGTIETANIAKEEGYTYYVLANHSTKGVGLYQPTSGSNTTFFRNASHKAYMKVAGAAQTAGYSFSFDWNGTTGIENIEGATEATNAVIYDITGRQIKAIVTPGIYIINGKKTFVK